MLAVDYLPTEGILTEAIQFLFAFEELSDAHVAKIRLQAEEILEYRFVRAADAVPMLSKASGRRLATVLKDLSSFHYMEGGVSEA